MTEIADDRSWWADVEHLRPGGEAPRPAPAAARSRATAVAERPARPAADGRSESGAEVESEFRELTGPPRRRITGGTGTADAPSQPRNRRRDVAAFADALDLDGAFGAPVTAPRSREIILTGTPSAREVDVYPHDDIDDGRPTDDAPAAERDRRTVQIRGTAGVHADVAERRALREIGERRPRSTAVERVAVRPDRIAMYVVLLGVFLVFLAVAGQSAGS